MGLRSVVLLEDGVAMLLEEIEDVFAVEAGPIDARLFVGLVMEEREVRDGRVDVDEERVVRRSGFADDVERLDLCAATRDAAALVEPVAVDIRLLRPFMAFFASSPLVSEVWPS